MRRMMRQIWNTKGLARWILLTGAVITVMFVLFAIFAPWIAPFDFAQTRDASGAKFEKLASPGGDVQGGLAVGAALDHVHDHAKGGTTSFRNLGWLCYHHHRLKTGGWVLGPRDPTTRKRKLRPPPSRAS